MTVANPDPGEIFYDDVHKTRLRFIGRDASERLIFEDIDESADVSPYGVAFIIMTDHDARHRIVVWTEESIKLGRGQVWARTRNDYSERRAVILVTFEFMGSTHVVYDEINGHGPVPKMKAEIDFRRVYGRLVEEGDEA